MQALKNVQWDTVFRAFRPRTLAETLCIGITLAMLATAGVFFVLPSQEAGEPASSEPIRGADRNPMYREDAACIRWPTVDCLFEMAAKKAAEPHPEWMIGQSRASDEAKAAKLRRVEQSDEYKRKHFAVSRRFAKVAVCMARAGRTESALEIFERHVTDSIVVRGLGVRRKTRHQTILEMGDAAASTGDLDGVLRILENARSTNERLWLLRRAGAVLAAADDISAALKIYEMIQAEAGTDSSPFPTSSKAVLLGAIAKAQLRAGNRGKAQARVDEIFALYARTRQADLHIVVDALLEMDDLRRARDAVTRFRGNHYLNAKRSTAAFVRYLARTGHAQAAIREANLINDVSSRNSVLYEVPALFFLATGEVTAATALVPVVGKFDNNPSNQASAIGAIAREVARTGDVAATLKLIEGMTDKLRQRSAYSSAADIFAKAGETETADLLLSKGNVRPFGRTEILLIIAIARGGEMHEAIRRSLDFPVGIVTVEGLCSTAVELASFSAVRRTWIRLLGRIGL